MVSGENGEQGGEVSCISGPHVSPETKQLDLLKTGFQQLGEREQ